MPLLGPKGKQCLVAVLCLGVFAASAFAQAPGNSPAAGQPTFGPFRGRSWATVDPDTPFVLDEGQPFEITVHYQLDAAEAVEGKYAYLSVEGLGPWRGPRRPGGAEAGHVWYSGLHQKRRIEVGRGKETFRFKAPQCKWRDELQMLVLVSDGHGGTLPFQARSQRMAIRNVTAPVVLSTGMPANLFTYDEPVVLRVLLRNLKPEVLGTDRVLSYVVRDTSGAKVARGDVPVHLERDEQTADLPLRLERRGTFLIQVRVPGVGQAETMLARVPDVSAVTGPTGRTQFGGTNIIEPADPARLEAGLRAVRRLGWSASRSFACWRDLEWLPGRYDLDAWEKPLDLAAKYGIDTVMLFTTPPIWARREDCAASWAAVPRWDAWEGLVRTFTTRFKGRLYGYEWLNEITPGGWWKGSAAEYVELCRIGTETARGIDPKLRFILAGGLWPRSFRLDVLGAGAGRYVDVLPLHYNSAPGVREARSDLDMHGLQRVAVWDDESSRPLVLWNEPLEKDLVDTTQAAWLLEQWPGELVAGAERIIWFGYRSPVGDYSPFFDDLTPRPVAATLAVFAAKLHGATPRGSFRLGQADAWQLFERDGRAVLVARSRGPETVTLPVGDAREVLVTDYQGNETRLIPADGNVKIALGPLGQFVELSPADALRMFAAVQVGRPEAATLTSSERGLVDDVAPERIPVLRGHVAQVPVAVANPFDRPIDVVMTPRAGEGDAAVTGQERRFRVEPGATVSQFVSAAVPEGATPGNRELELVFRFEGPAGKRLPEVSKCVVLGVVAPEMLGNLFPNGSFEADADGDGKPDHWRLWRDVTLWWPSDFPGTGGHCVRMNPPATGKYAAFGSPRVAVSPGQKYLYSAWVWCDGMGGGSNINEHFADGSDRRVQEPRVFGLRDTRCWQLYTKVYHAPEGVESITVSPVVAAARPDGFTLYDNLRWTIYAGTDYAAECHRRKADVKVDGLLDEWVTVCPVPLLGPNQLEPLSDAYQWSPANLSGVAYLMWDEGNLYVALVLNDDVLKVTGDSWAAGDPTEGDCLVLALAPDRASPSAATEAFELQVALGTGGRPLVCRPETRAGGLRSGHLYKDSSEMEVAVLRAEAPTPTDPGPGNGPLPDAPAEPPRAGQTVYEMRIPFSQLGSLRGSIGCRFGLALVVIDNDGAGPAARMTWGRGTNSTWSPAHFGCATFVE